jgi:hypothetical protein
MIDPKYVFDGTGALPPPFPCALAMYKYSLILGLALFLREVHKLLPVCQKSTDIV